MPGKNVDYQLDSNKIVKTFGQGASDNGSYDYLRDISRIETLVKSDERIKRGYAIIISNESLYWGNNKKSVANSPWRNFFLYKMDDAFNPLIDEKFVKGNKLNWVDKNTGMELCGGNDDSRGERKNCICLAKEYTLEWKKYCNINGIGDTKTKAHPFKFLLCEIGNDK